MLRLLTGALFAIWLTGAGEGFVRSALAQEAVVIDRIIVEGTQRIEPATVVSYLTVRPGDPLTPQSRDSSITSLFRTGLFADVELRLDGTALIVSVAENPIINRIAFEGNLRIDDEVLLAEVQLRPRIVYSRARVQTDVARLLELYRRSGRFAATIEPRIIRLDQNRVDLVFEIDEGPLTGVRRISFIGNQAFSDGELRDVVETEQTRWWAFLATNDNYDPDRLAFDRELLRRFYLEEGYADFRVISAVAELTPDNEEFFITFTVEEGERYTFGEVDLTSQLPDLPLDELRGELVMSSGDWYSSADVEETIDNLTEALGDLQFAFARVDPLITRNREELLINITFDIEEGERVFVERIDISGNVRTVDRVIRREFELVEGDPFNTSRLRRSETQIRNLGYFRTVDVRQVAGSSPDRTVIEVEVEEQSTGELSLGAGFSSISGPLADISLRERNLLGRGQDLRLGFSISGDSQEFDVSFTEPYFLERDLAAGFDLFRIVRDNQDESSFDEEVLGFAIRAGFPLTGRLRQDVRYVLSDRTIENIDEDASRFIREQEGSTLTSALGTTLSYDRLDSRIFPTEGYFLSLSGQVAGLGGDVSYLRTTVRGSYYMPIIDDDVILNVSGSAGYIVGLGEDVRINDRFFVGGNNFRGFSVAGIGPRDANGDALGGNRFAIGTVEVGFPVGLPDELGIRGRTFADVGVLGDVDAESTPADPIFDEESLRASVGVGLSWSSPFGPLALDFAIPVLSEDFDEEENFRFSFGTRF